MCDRHGDQLLYFLRQGTVDEDGAAEILESLVDLRGQLLASEGDLGCRYRVHFLGHRSSPSLRRRNLLRYAMMIRGFTRRQWNVRTYVLSYRP
jgi:hypothetical protein